MQKFIQKFQYSSFYISCHY